MEEQKKGQSLLQPYRVLDLTEGGALICGKILADLGADVIKIEPPGGSPSRDIGPFYGEINHRDKSLFWFAYSANKKSITLDIFSVYGQDTLKGLVRNADLVIESFTPGFLDGFGLGYTTLREINRQVIMTSITPFGQTGPKAFYKSCDLTTWASSGILYVCGDTDRPPCWVSFPQSSLHAGTYAAAASLLALFHRSNLGEGQHVDVSTQECLIKTTCNAHLVWEILGQQVVRAGGTWTAGGLTLAGAQASKAKLGFPCRDGFIAVNLFGGTNPAYASSAQRLVEWMEEEGMAPEWLKNFDWVHEYDPENLHQHTVDRVEEQWTSFFLTKTKAELYHEAIKRGLLIAPINNTKDLWESPQLEARGFWQKLKHLDLGDTITYCGSFAKVNGASLEIRSPAPLIGQHNKEILGNSSNIPYKPVMSKLTTASQARLETMDKRLPLKGIKIVEFAWMAVGPLIGAYMANYGATVVKIESHTAAQPFRYMEFQRDDLIGAYRSAYFANWNSSKYGISLNLNKPRAKDIAMKLIDWADIMTESFSAMRMNSWGLGYDEVRKFKPDIIYLSTNQQGQSGPYAKFAGFGHHAAALAGITEITGWPDRDPIPPRGVYIDFVAPPFGLATILAALDHRSRTDQGVYIDLAQVETGLQFIAPVIMDYIVNRNIYTRNGNHLCQAAPHGVYPCRGDDRWVAIGVFSDEEWQALCTAIDKQQWAQDPEYGTYRKRKANEDVLDRLIGEYTIQHTQEEVESVLQSIGIAVHAVTSCGELLDDPQLMHRRYFHKLDHPVVGSMSYEGPPFKLSKASTNIFKAPRLGEHNNLVYREILGLSNNEISDLVDQGVITG